jgi:tetratricopeptide (TPR) repeat protein
MKLGIRGLFILLGSLTAADVPARAQTTSPTSTKEPSLGSLDPFKSVELTNEALRAFANGGRGLLDAKQYFSSVSQYCVSIAEHRLLKKDYDGAIFYLNKAIALDHRSAIAYELRGRAYAGKGDPVEAVIDYTSAITLSPNSPSPYRARGSAYATMGEVALANDDFVRFRDLQPDAPKPETFDSHAIRGLNLLNQGDYAAALGELTKAIEIDGRWGFMFEHRGRAYAGLSKIDLALADFNRAIDIDPKLINSFYYRAMVHLIGKSHSSAIADLKSALTIDPDHAKSREVLTMLGER